MSDLLLRAEGPGAGAYLCWEGPSILPEHVGCLVKRITNDRVARTAHDTVALCADRGEFIGIVRRVEVSGGRVNLVAIQGFGYVFDYPFVAKKPPECGRVRLVAGGPNVLRVLPADDAHPAFEILEVDPEQKVFTFCFPGIYLWDCGIPIPKEDCPREPVTRALHDEFVEKIFRGYRIMGRRRNED
jgi:hypothetical protein